MARTFDFGVQVMKLDAPDHITSVAREIESLGYGAMYSYDHFGTVDPFVPLVVAALATEHLRVGPLVLNNEFHQPALLARTAATVDAMIGGRLTLGLGTGYRQSEHDAIGVELRAPGERVTRFGESLRILRSLLSDGSCTFDGVHHRIAVDELGVTPAQRRIPFLIGGHGQRVVHLGAEHADIFQFTGLTHGEGGAISPGGFCLADVVERHDWLRRAAGERFDEIERSILVQHTSIGDTAADALPELAERFQLPEAELEQCPFVLVGSVEQVVDKLERLRERLGITNVVVRDHEGFAPVVAALG